MDMIWKLNSTAQLRSIQSLVSMPPKPFFMQSIYRPATAMTQSSTLRKACCEICLTTGKAMQVPRMTPGAPYMAQVSTVGV